MATAANRLRPVDESGQAVDQTPSVSLGAGAVDRQALRSMILTRIAVATGATRTDLAKDILPLAAQELSPDAWRNGLQIDLGVLKADGLITEKAGRLRASETGEAAVAQFLGGKGKPPAVWPEMRNIRLVAKALGVAGEPAKRLALLAKPDGLRMQVVQTGYGLAIKGNATPVRLRSALAVVALERAFGNQITSGLGASAGLSAKASRLLAAQLSAEPRDFGTDRRLIAVLAAEVVGAAQSDFAALQSALLRKLLTGEKLGVPVGKKSSVGSPAGSKRRAGRKSSRKNHAAAPAASDAGQANAPAANGASMPPAVAAAPVAVSALAPVKPDLAGFSKAVLKQAQANAQGWPGDRKAFISHVSQSIRAQHPQWGLSDIEFKCMLAEAHQAGHLLLAYADLKDKKTIKDVQASAFAYKNTVWHYVRVEE